MLGARRTPASWLTSFKARFISFSPDLVALRRAEVATGQKAVSTTMARAGAGLKFAWRGQITGSGLGQRLANTIRSQTYPKGRNNQDAAALVWSNAPIIIGAHDTGPLIRSGNGFWLAIPLLAAGKAQGGKRITSGMWEQKTGLRLRFVYRDRGPSLLVADAVRLNTRGQAAISKSKTGKGQATAPIFLLVRPVKLPKHLGSRARCRTGAGGHSRQHRGKVASGVDVFATFLIGADHPDETLNVDAITRLQVV